jgi:hypothetical protein
VRQVADKQLMPGRVVALLPNAGLVNKLGAKAEVFAMLNDMPNDAITVISVTKISDCPSSLEYTAEYIESILSSIDHLVSIGDFEFNYCEGEALSFVLEKWVGAETLKDIMRKQGKLARETYMPGIASRLQVGPTSSIP